MWFLKKLWNRCPFSTPLVQRESRAISGKSGTKNLIITQTVETMTSFKAFWLLNLRASKLILTHFTLPSRLLLCKLWLMTCEYLLPPHLSPKTLPSKAFPVPETLQGLMDFPASETTAATYKNFIVIALLCVQDVGVQLSVNILRARR